MEDPWPDISYFREESKWSSQVLSELEKVDEADWFCLYFRKSDSSYWRLAIYDKYQTRHLVRIHDLADWVGFDSSELEKRLLFEHRGGLSDEKCRWSKCQEQTILKSAFCLEHSYKLGVRE